MPLRVLPLVSLLLMTVFFLTASPQTSMADEGLSEAEREEIQDLIREYLRDNPEVLVEAIRALREKQEMAEREAAQAAIAHFNARLDGGLNAPSIGSASASVTIAEFFDYRCGYCKKVLSDIMTVMETDQDIRFVFMEFPILGEDSMTASRASLAVWLNWPDRYLEVHNALMGSRGNLTPDKITGIIAHLGIDADALRDAMESPEIDKLIEENYRLAESMNINGTPAFIIGDQLYPGAIGLEDFRHLIDMARNG